jgi:hypothetical protein
MTKPIFILGVHRSGTTWVANILCSHHNIAGVQAPRHHGIHESAFFCTIKDRYGNLQDDNNYIEFLETFSASDYFLLSNLDKNFFYTNRPTSYDEFFKQMMDTYAEQQHKEFWLEKTPAHTLYYDDLQHIFPAAKFIIVKRNIIDSIKSDVRLRYFTPDRQRKTPLSKILFIVFLAFRYSLFYSAVLSKQHKENSLFIEYEQIKKYREAEIKKICDFIGVNFETQLLQDTYEPNTRFTSEKERITVLANGELTFIKILDFIFRLLPKTFLCGFLPIYKKQYRDRYGLPEWFYSMTKEKFGSIKTTK